MSNAAFEVYEVLRDAIRACQEVDLIPAGDPESFALTAWSTVHGLAVLLLDGLLDGHVGSIEQGAKLVEVVTEILGHGLELR